MQDNENYSRNIIKQCFLSRDAFMYCIDKIFDDQFFASEETRLYWKAFLSIESQNVQLTISSLMDVLNFSSNGEYIDDFNSLINSIYQDEDQWKYHLMYLDETFKKKILLAMSREVQKDISNYSVDEMSSRIRQVMTKIDSNIVKTSSFSNAYRSNLKIINDYRSGNKKPIIYTGNSNFDRIVSLSDTKLIVIGAQKKVGKCFGKDTQVMMYDHSIKMIQDLRIGDVLMGPDGTPRSVLTTVSGKDEMFEIKQSKAMTYIVNSEHILTLKSVHKLFKEKIKGRISTYAKGTVTDISVKEWLKKSPYWKNKNKGYKGISSEFDIPIELEPYLLGLWIGDGDRRDPVITNMDPEIKEYLYSIGDVTEKKDPRSKASRFHLRRRVWKFRRYSLLGKNPKRIPIDYLLNTMDVKLELLAGIIDTDGHKVNNKNKSSLGYELSQTNKDLMDQIEALVLSCGFMVKRTKKRTSCLYKGIKVIGEAHKLYITGDLSRIPVRIERKKMLKRNGSYDPTLSNISVTSIGSGTYYGITVDKDELFMLSDYTVVHNSRFVIDLMNRVIERNQDIAIMWFSFEMMAEELIRCFISRKLKLTDNQLLSKGYFMTDSVLNRIQVAADDFDKYPISFVDEPSTVFNISSLYERFCDEHKGKSCICIIDNLGLIKPHIGESVAYEDDIARILKGLRDKTKSTIIALHHLTKESESKWNKEVGYEPKINHIRGSSRIVDFANQVLLLHRPDHYSDLMDQARNAGAEKELLGVFMVDCALNRNGESGKIKMKHEIGYCFFEE